MNRPVSHQRCDKRFWPVKGLLSIVVDALPTPPYASCSIRERLSICLKDIGNYTLEQVQAALKHLDEAVSRLETVAAQVQTQLPLAKDAVVYQEKLADLSKQNS